MTVQPEEYMPKTVEYCHFLNRFIVRVRETEQLWTGEDDFILEKPKLDIRIIPVSHSDDLVGYPNTGLRLAPPWKIIKYDIFGEGGEESEGKWRKTLFKTFSSTYFGYSTQ